MVWAWMLWSPHALGARTELWLGMNGFMVWAWMLWSPYALGTRTGLLLGHGWGYCLSMDALLMVSECSWNKNRMTAWAWKVLWFGHACSGYHVLLEHERDYALGHGWDYGLGMDALVTACSWSTNGIAAWGMDGIMLWAWVLWSPCALRTRKGLRLRAWMG